MVMNGGSYFNLHRNLRRTTSEEKRDLECLEKPMYDSLRQAVKVHCQVRKYMRSIIKPGMLMVDLCENLENIVFGTLSASGRCIPYRLFIELEVGQNGRGGEALNRVTLHW